MGIQIAVSSVTSLLTRPPACGSLVSFFEALRAGTPLEIASAEHGLSLAVARCVAGSPLAKAILAR